MVDQSISDLSLPLVGREAEIAILTSHVEGAEAGAGSCLFITGEAGIGKTRLVEEVLDVREDLRILRGRCLPETMEPLAPFREALRDQGIDTVFGGTGPPRLEAIMILDAERQLVVESRRAGGDLSSEKLLATVEVAQRFLADTLQTTTPGLFVMGYGELRIVINPIGTFTMVAILVGRETEHFLNDIQDLIGGLLASVEWIAEQDVADLGVILNGLVNSLRYQGEDQLQDPALRRENLLDELLYGLQRLAKEETVILFLDDLHWADPSTLTAVAYLARNISSDRVLIIGTYRPEEILAGWDGLEHTLRTTITAMQGEGSLIEVPLPRLGEAALEALLTASLPRVDDLERLVRTLLSEADGNPLLTREVLLGLLATGRIRTMADRTVVGDLSFATMGVAGEHPHERRFVDLMTYRLEALQEEDLETLQCAAVIGTEFTTVALACATESDPATITRALQTIATSSALVQPSKDGWRFDHAKLREVLYSGLAEDLRRAYHAAIGDCLVLGEPFPGQDFALAFHFDRADDKRALDHAVPAARQAAAEFATDEARRMYRIALAKPQDDAAIAQLAEEVGDVEERVGAFDQALVHYDRAHDLVKLPADRSRLLLKQARVLTDQGDLGGAITLGHAARDLAPDGSLEVIQAMMVICNALRHHGDYVEASVTVEMILTRSGLPAEIVGAAIQLQGSLLRQLGDYPGALEAFQRAFAIRRDLGDRRGQAGTLNEIGIIHLDRGALEPALMALEGSLAMYQAIGYKLGIAAALLNIGLIHRDLGDLPQALEYQERSLVLAQAMGDTHGMGQCYNNIGAIHQNLGHLELGLEFLGRARVIRERSEERQGLGTTLQNLGTIHRYLEHHEEAKRLSAQAFKIHQELGDRKGMSSSLVGLAAIHYSLGETVRAAGYAKRGLRIATEIGTPMTRGRGLVYVGLASLGQAQGRSWIDAGLALIPSRSHEAAEMLFLVSQALKDREPEQATEMLGKSRRLFERFGNGYWLALITDQETSLRS